jgi:hypothetical protein
VLLLSLASVPGVVGAQIEAVGRRPGGEAFDAGYLAKSILHW